MIRFPVCRFSKPVVSATHPPLRLCSNLKLLGGRHASVLPVRVTKIRFFLQLQQLDGFNVAKCMNLFFRDDSKAAGRYINALLTYNADAESF